MTISVTLIWLLIGLALCAAELLTGTFYLLMLGLGCLAGAVAAVADLGFGWQCTAGGVVAAIAGFVFHRVRNAKSTAQSEALQHLDVGQIVTVQQWNADGTASVRYRGAPWVCRLENGADVATGPHRVVSVDGACLIVRPVKAG